MKTITITRADVSAQEIAATLRAGLGGRYHVLPGMRSARRPLARPVPAAADAILVGTGSNRLFTAQLTIVRDQGATLVQISPGGLGWETAVNAVGITRRVRRVLADDGR